MFEKGIILIIEKIYPFFLILLFFYVKITRFLDRIKDHSSIHNYFDHINYTFRYISRVFSFFFIFFHRYFEYIIREMR